MIELHPQRCDTCSHFDKYAPSRYSQCKKLGIQVDGEDIAFIAKIGCASHHLTQISGEPMELPEEMPFTPDEISMRKFVITDAQLREYFDAWMYSDKDARRLTELNTVIRDRTIAVGNISGMFCASCHTHKTSGYYLCEECYNTQRTTIRTDSRNELLRQLTDMIMEEAHIVPNAPFDPNNDRIPEIGIDVLGEMIVCLRKDIIRTTGREDFPRVMK